MNAFEIFWMYFKVSAMTFGGGIAILGIVSLELEKRGDITEEEIADMNGLAAAMPGPVGVSSAFLVGKRYGNYKGAAAGVVGAILPPFLAIVLLAPVIIDNINNPALQRFFSGVLAGKGAMITVMVAKTVKRAIQSDIWNLLPYFTVIILLGFVKTHPVTALAAGFMVKFTASRLRRLCSPR